MSKTPQVSVLMTVLDPHPTYYRIAIESVLAQTLHDFELIVIERVGSSETGRNIAAGFSDGRVRYWPMTTNTSHVAQRNCGVARASADILAWLDADDIAEPERLKKQLEFLRSHKDVDVVGSQLTIIDEQGATYGHRKYPEDHGAIVGAMARFNPIAQSSVMCRKRVIVGAGGYQFGAFPGNEDYELWSRLARCGVRFANHPESLVQYRLHRLSMKATNPRGILLGTLAVKKEYWWGRMSSVDWMRYVFECGLLWLPRSVVLLAFAATHYRSGFLKRVFSGIYR